MDLSSAASDRTSLAEAATALRKLIVVPSSRSAQRWPQKNAEEVLEIINRRTANLDDRIALSFLLADLFAVQAIENQEIKSLRISAVQLYIVGNLASRNRNLSNGERLAGLKLAQEIEKFARIPPSFRKALKESTRTVSSFKEQPDWGRLFLNDTVTGELVRDVILEVQRASISTLLVSYPTDGPTRDELSSADLLSLAANRQSAEVEREQESQVTYDLSDIDVKLISIELRGFRGAPKDLQMDFTMRNSAVSAVVFGENGVGKSTIVDAIEFALQGRIGRSSYFDSPLLPSVRNLSESTTVRVEAKLSDNTSVERSVITVSDRIEVRPATVRAGFRLAPVSIKRSDILRFLDTEALERGSTFLDYFPADAEQLAIRPDEEVHRLQAEMADLRIRRSTLANELSQLIPADESVLSNRDKFQAAIKTHIMKGQSKSTFEAEGGWDNVPAQTRDVIGKLREVFQSLTVTKRRMDQTTEIFNPIAHPEQLRILRAVLEEVGRDISQAFPRIANDYPIDAIEVVFGASSTLSLDIVITLSNGFKCFPQQIFSEAYQDLLALLFFTSVAKEAAKRGQSRILLMDDVLQSIDATVRHSLVDYILSEFADWQLIFTTHDRLWRDQLRDLFDAHQHRRVERSVYSWDFEDGPRLMAVGADSLSRDLRASLGSAEPRTIGALAGQLLEVISDQLTRRMNLKVARTMEDKYTLGDLWQPMYDALSETSAKDIVTKIASHRRVRNLVMHANNVSLGLSLRDAEDFADSVLALYDSVKCNICGSWVKGQRHPSCTCKNLQL